MSKYKVTEGKDPAGEIGKTSSDSLGEKQS